MEELLETIRSAGADGATAEQKAAGVTAARTIASALEAQVGKPITLPGVPPANPLTSIFSPQTLDLVIAYLRNRADQQDAARNSNVAAPDVVAAPTAAVPGSPAQVVPVAGMAPPPGVRFALVPAPPRGVSVPRQPARASRPVAKRRP